MLNADMPGNTRICIYCSRIYLRCLPKSIKTFSFVVYLKTYAVSIYLFRLGATKIQNVLNYGYS